MVILGSGLGIVLSLVFGCLLLALIAELYYLLWWKKLRTATTTTSLEADFNTKDLFPPFFCWNKPSAGREGNPEGQQQQDPQDVEAGAPTKDAEAELLTRLQNRLLFTIKEETTEDLESEDGRSKASRKGSRTRSLSDLILAVDSVPNPLECYTIHGHGFNNPLFESRSSVLSEAELDRIKSSPPPKFKFLRDAEEKLYKRLMEEADKIGNNTTNNSEEEEGDDLRHGSFIRIIVGKNTNYNHHSSSSQVLPLSSSPINTSVHNKETHF